MDELEKEPIEETPAEPEAPSTEEGEEEEKPEA